MRTMRWHAHVKTGGTGHLYQGRWEQIFHLNGGGWKPPLRSYVPFQDTKKSSHCNIRVSAYYFNVRLLEEPCEMSIQELTALIPPPENPLEIGTDEQWTAMQKELNLELPTDFRDLGMTYGSGGFWGEESGLVNIYQPFACDFRENVELHKMFLSDEREENASWIPYAVYPEPGGLLVWGGDDNGNGLYWLTEGDPDKWPILVQSHGDDPSEQWEQFDGPMTSFLAKAFTRQIEVSVWLDWFSLGTKNIEFRPFKKRIVPQGYSALELYVTNGNKAGFWIKNVDDTYESLRYLVTHVDGKTEGPLEGVPKEYLHQRVTALRYASGKFDGQTGFDGASDSWLPADPPVLG